MSISQIRGTDSVVKSLNEPRLKDSVGSTSQTTGIQTQKLDFGTLTDAEKQNLEEQVKKLNHSIASSGKQLQFKYNDEAAQLYVEIIDMETNEVVSSLPPEFLIDLSLKMKEMIGMFMDKKI
jgi:flagellar protein FlaG